MITIHSYKKAVVSVETTAFLFIRQTSDISFIFVGLYRRFKIGFAKPILKALHPKEPTTRWR